MTHSFPTRRSSDLTKIDLVLVVLAPRGSPLSWFGRFSDRPRRLTCLFGRANHLVLDLPVLWSLRCTVHCLSPRHLRLSASVRRHYSPQEEQIGRAPCRERVCQYVSI